MPKQTKFLQPPLKGFNSDIDPKLLPDSIWEVAKNIQIKDGSMSPRKGVTSVANTSAGYNSLTIAKSETDLLRADNEVNIYANHNGTNVKAWDDTNTTQNNIYTDGNIKRTFSVEDRIYIHKDTADGKDHLHSYEYLKQSRQGDTATDEWNLDNAYPTMWDEFSMGYFDSAYKDGNTAVYVIVGDKLIRHNINGSDLDPYAWKIKNAGFYRIMGVDATYIYVEGSDRFWQITKSDGSINDTVILGAGRFNYYVNDAGNARVVCVANHTTSLEIAIFQIDGTQVGSSTTLDITDIYATPNDANFSFREGVHMHIDATVHAARATNKDFLTIVVEGDNSIASPNTERGYHIIWIPVNTSEVPQIASLVHEHFGAIPSEFNFYGLREGNFICSGYDSASSKVYTYLQYEHYQPPNGDVGQKLTLKYEIDNAGTFTKAYVNYGAEHDWGRFNFYGNDLFINNQNGDAGSVQGGLAEFDTNTDTVGAIYEPSINIPYLEENYPNGPESSNYKFTFVTNRDVETAYAPGKFKLDTIEGKTLKIKYTNLNKRFKYVRIYKEISNEYFLVSEIDLTDADQYMGADGSYFTFDTQGDEENPLDTYFSLNGITEESYKEPYAYKVVATGNDRLFVGNLTLDGDRFPNRISWSMVGKPAIVNKAKYIDIGEDGSDEITALKFNDDVLYVFKKNSITMYDVSSYNEQEWFEVGKVNGIGILSDKTFAATPYGIFFCSSDGVYRYDRGSDSRLQNLTDGIWEKIYKTLTIDYMFYVPNERYVCVVSAGSIYVYDIEHGAWLLYEFQDGYLRIKDIQIDHETGEAYAIVDNALITLPQMAKFLDGNTDFGGTITASCSQSEQNFGLPFNYKKKFYLKLLGSPATVTVTGNQSTVTDSMTIATQMFLSDRDIDMSIALTFTTGSIQGLRIEYEPQDVEEWR